MKISLLCVPILALVMASNAAADPAEGIWITPPDRKNLTSYIEVRRCGDALCGRVLRAYDPSGREVMTRNVGKELFWGLRPQGGGTYGDGTAIVPLLNVKAKATARLTGNRMTVTGCKGRICDSQVWSRL